jgi:hypothetical protein
LVIILLPLPVFALPGAGGGTRTLRAGIRGVAFPRSGRTGAATLADGGTSLCADGRIGIRRDTRIGIRGGVLQAS